MSLYRILAYLEYMSFFPDPDLFKEIKSILHYLCIYLHCNNVQRWYEVTKQLKNICDNNWANYNTYQLFKLQCKHSWFQKSSYLANFLDEYHDPKLRPFEKDLNSLVIHAENYYSVTSSVIRNKFGIEIKPKDNK